MSGTFGEATGGEEADRKYGREDRLREDVKEELWGGGGGGKRRRRRSRRCRGEERGSDSRESLPPALSQPHAWPQLLLIVIAVQTRPTAATNISCLT